MGGSSGYASGYLTCSNIVGGSDSSSSSFMISSSTETRYSVSDMSARGVRVGLGGEMRF